MKSSEFNAIVAEVASVNDEMARELVSELIVLRCLPKDRHINTLELIEAIVEEGNEIQREVPAFDLSVWSGETVIESIDFLITCGAISGPIVDIATESHKLLESTLSRSDLTDLYETGLLHGLFEFTPETKTK